MIRTVGGVPLACVYLPTIRPIVTVELYVKWYSLYVVHPGGEIQTVDFGVLEKHTKKSPYVDHVPNPAAVERWAESMDYDVDEVSLDIMVGRWMLEAKDVQIEEME